MNKDTKGLTTEEQFNLVITKEAVEREFMKIKKPTVSVEDLPASFLKKLGVKPDVIPVFKPVMPPGLQKKSPGRPRINK